MSHHGIEVGSDLVRMAEAFSIPEGIRCTAELLAGDAPPTAIVAGNDMLALGCCTAAEAAGMRCPDDLSIVGYNDMPFMDRLSPPLTTVRIPHYALGARAGELLLERIDHPDAPLRSTLLVPQLVVRGSTASAR
jgi:LacI family transcriptional regulator